MSFVHMHLYRSGEVCFLTNSLDKANVKHSFYLVILEHLLRNR